MEQYRREQHDRHFTYVALEVDLTLARLKHEIHLLEGMDTLRCN